MSYETLKLRLHNNGNLRQAKIDDARFVFDYEFENDVSFTPDICLCEGVTPKKPLAMRVFSDSYSSSSGYTKKYAVKIKDALKVGDLLYDCEENIYWLCKSAFKKGGIYCTGSLQRCVDMPIKWQDNDGNVFEYPVFDYSQFTNDETDLEVVNVGVGRFKLTTIADDNTVKLKHDKRFFWDRNMEKPAVIKVTNTNSTSMFYDKGLVILTAMEDQYNPDKDNLSEWLCDYKEPKSSAPVLQFNVEKAIRIGRSKRVWVDTEDNVEWDIKADGGVNTEKNGNNVKITVAANESLIGGIIRVSATVNGETSACEFEIVGGV